MAHLAIWLLGRFHVTLDGAPVVDFSTDKARALLAYLAVEGDRPHRRETLTGLLWPEQPQSKARQNLRQTLLYLRQAIDDGVGGAPFLTISRESIQVDPAGDHWLDVAEFLQLGRDCRGHRHRRLDGCLPCTRRMERMVALYDGDFLEGFFLADSNPFEEWATLQRERLRREVVQALSLLVAYCERRGDLPAARRHANRQVELEPWREEAHRSLMRLMALDGERSTALVQYELCRRHLAGELGVEPAEETRALYQEIRSQEWGQRRRVERSGPPIGLPPAPTPFIGREAELGELADLLANPDCRLLTLVGPGGIGKTRLALGAAADQSGLFRDGVGYVPLAPLDSAAGLAPAIWEVLGLGMPSSQDPAKRLLAHLGRKELLLVLDNMEHVAEGKELLARILARAQGVVILVTSRERLSLREEWVYEVEGLPFPGQPDGRGLETYSAVTLFVESARRVHRRFAITREQEPFVARLCRMVEGMPLAVELAAAWMPVRTPEEVAREVERNLGILTARYDNVPERGRSLVAAFEHSWRLLSEPERRTLAQLSVFRDGFDPCGAEAVAGASPDLLVGLTHKSLLRRDGAGRWGMHALLQRYSAGKLAEGVGPLEETRGRHGRYYARRAQEWAESLIGPGSAAALVAMRADLGNVRAAWRWAIEGARLADLERLLAGLSRFYSLRGPLGEGVALFEEAIGGVRAFLGRAAGEELVKARLVLGRLLREQASLLFGSGGYDRAALALEAALVEIGRAPAQSLEAAAELRLVEASCQALWGKLCTRQRRYAEAQAHLEVALGQAQQAGHTGMAAGCLRDLGHVFVDRGDFSRAKPYYDQAVALCRDLGDELEESHSVLALAVGSCYWGDYDGAELHMQRALALFRRLGRRRDEAMTLAHLSLIPQVRGDAERARAYAEEAAGLTEEAHDLPGLSFALTRLGRALAELGALEEAESAYRRAVEIRQEIGEGTLALESLAGLACVKLAQGESGQALAHVDQILAHLEADSLDGTHEPFWVHLCCYQVLQAGRDPRAQGALNAAYHALQERAALITDPDMRKAFLGRIPSHREIVALVEADRQQNARFDCFAKEE